MRFKSALSTNPDTSAAVAEVCEAVAGLSLDLSFVFVSPHHEDEFDSMIRGIREGTNARNLIGCTGEGIIGPDREVERSPALALWAAELPGVRVLPFVMDLDDVANFETDDDWRDRVGAGAGDPPCFVVLPEPFTFGRAIEHTLDRLDALFPVSTTVGGLSSGAESPGQNRLFLNDQVLRTGLVGVSLSGAVVVDAVVSQGCRPVGEPFVVTKAERNVIQELRGRPAVEILQGVYRSASQDEQALMQQGVHVGSVVDEGRGVFKQGDFLVRNLMGVVEETGIAVAALIRLGQTIQFHVRDSRIADQEMKALVGRKLEKMKQPPAGGLLFTCNGRGTRMFGKPNHDIDVVKTLAADCEVAGFFAAGEIGPIGKHTFIHGFTSSLVLFREP